MARRTNALCIERQPGNSRKDDQHRNAQQAGYCRYNSEMLEGYTKIYGWHKREITHKVSGLKSHNPAKNRWERTEVLVYNYTPHGTLSLF